MQRFSHSGQHYPDPSQPHDGEDNYTPDASKRVKTNQSFESLFDNEELSDIILNINDGQFIFHGHKMILGLKSDILAHLSNEVLPLDSNKSTLHLQELDECGIVFSRFLYFIYTGAVWLHRDYVIPLKQLAGKYVVKPLVLHCQSYIMQILNNMIAVCDNVHGFSVETVCDLYENESPTEELREACFNVLCQKFKELVRCERWKQCKWQLVFKLLKSEECHAEENVILTAATDWMKKNNLQDKSQIEDILMNIRYPMLNRRVLYHLQKNGAFKNFPRIQELVNDAIKYHCFKDLPEAKEEFVGTQYQHRHHQCTRSTSIQSSQTRSSQLIHTNENTDIKMIHSTVHSNK